MQEHSTQQAASDSSPQAHQNAAEKLSGAMMSLNMAGNVAANQAPKSSTASDATTLGSDFQQNTCKSAKKKLADKERSKKKRAMKKLKNKGGGMESIGKEGDSKDVDKSNTDVNCTLEQLLEEGDELQEDLRYIKMQDQMMLSVHPIMRAALMEDGAAKREENHKDWTVRRDSFVARGEAAISNKQNTAQKPSIQEAQAVRLLQEYLRMKTIVL